MRKLLLLSTFFIATPFLLIFSIVLFSLNRFNSNQTAYMTSVQAPKDIVYASLPSSVNLVDEQITTQDARVAIVQQFLERYHSPLAQYAQEIVDEADAYGISYKWLPAIAMQESNLCLKAPAGSNNCWGYGIYGKKILTFPDYSTAITTVTKGLATNYIHKGLDTPDKMMHTYTPPSQGSWASSVNHFMGELQ